MNAKGLFLVVAACFSVLAVGQLLRQQEPESAVDVNQRTALLPVADVEPLVRPRTSKSPMDRKLYLKTGTVDTARLDNLAVPGRAPFEANKAYVLQLNGPMTPQKRTVLKEAGVKLGDYLPKNAFIAGLGGVRPAVLAALPFVNWVGEFQNDWKLEPDLGKHPYLAPERQAMADHGEFVAIITLFQQRSASQVRAAIEAMDGGVVHRVTRVGGNRVVSATLPLAKVASLAALDSVQFIEEAPEFIPCSDDTRWVVQSNDTTNCDVTTPPSYCTPLYLAGLHGEGQIVGVIDDGLHAGHCVFTYEGYGATVPKILENNSPSATENHGTAVAAIAVGDYGVNNQNKRGVAYLAQMVFSARPSTPDEDNILELLDLHHSQGARIHTNSWSYGLGSEYKSSSRGVDSFLYQNPYDFATAAVGNYSGISNPAVAKNCLAVSATKAAPDQDEWGIGWYGPTEDGRRRPEIMAPGYGVMAATGSSCSVAEWDGTSFATPAVAGVAALVRQYYTEGFYPDGEEDENDEFTPSGALIKATLINSAQDMTTGTEVEGYPSDYEGWGLLVADEALYFDGDTRKLAVLADVRNTVGLSTLEQDALPLIVEGSGGQLRVTLAWTEPPASVSADPAIVNDLDLEVEAPNGTVFLGNDFCDGVSVTSGDYCGGEYVTFTRDDRNNVEQVHVNSPQTGEWEIRVKGSDVNIGRQGYALIATGDIQSTDILTNSQGFQFAHAVSTKVHQVTPHLGVERSIPAGDSECRDIDGTLSITVTFDEDVFSADGNGFAAGDFTVDNGTVVTAGSSSNEVNINVSSVADEDCFTIFFTAEDVLGSEESYEFSWPILLGDADNNGVVDGDDEDLLESKDGQQAGLDFRCDLDLNGVIEADPEGDHDDLDLVVVTDPEASASCP